MNSGPSLTFIVPFSIYSTVDAKMETAVTRQESPLHYHDLAPWIFKTRTLVLIWCINQFSFLKLKLGMVICKYYSNLTHTTHTHLALFKSMHIQIQFAPSLVLLHNQIYISLSKSLWCLYRLTQLQLVLLKRSVRACTIRCSYHLKEITVQKCFCRNNSLH